MYTYVVKNWSDLSVKGDIKVVPKNCKGTYSIRPAIRTYKLFGVAIHVRTAGHGDK